MIYNPFPAVELPFGKDNKYFCQLFDAISLVPNKYIRYSIPSGCGRYQYVPHLERVFAYELYRQWGNILEKEKEKLILNGEIDKIINITSIEYKKECEDNNDETGKVILYPDIVLHHSQADDNKQLIICEIKKNHKLSGTELFGDLYKLSCYLTKGVIGEGMSHFKYAVFLIVDSDLSIIKSKVKNNTEIIVNGTNKRTQFSTFIKDKKLSPSFSRIVCVAYDGIKLEYHTFDKLI